MIEFQQDPAELAEEILKFETWFEAEELSSKSKAGRTPVGIARVKFKKAKALIIEEAKKGYPRTSIYKFLKVEGKINCAFATFCEHLKKEGMQKYFADYKEKATNKKPTEQKSEQGTKTLSIPKPKPTEKDSQTPKKFGHKPTPQKENLPPKSSENPNPPKRQWIIG